MVDGRVKLAMNAIQGLTIWSSVVYRQDEFHWQQGLTPDLRHVPNWDAERSDADIIAAYAVVDAPDWKRPMFDVMSRRDLDRRRAMSRARNSPWDKWFDEMCCKTVTSHVLKRLPRSADQPAEPTVSELRGGGHGNGTDRPVRSRNARIA